MIDDAYLNGYAKHLGVSATVVYLSLCRHADKDQSAFPSQELIAKEHNMSPRTVWAKLKELEKWNIIRSERTRTAKGRWLNNTYLLLDKSEWKDPSATIASGHPFANNDTTHSQITANTHSQPLRTKDTHTLDKDTHIKYTHTLSLAEVDFQEISDKYQVPLSFVISKYDDMLLWAGEKPNNPKLKGRNWKLTLMRWVKDDAVKIRKENNGQSKIAFINPR